MKPVTKYCIYNTKTNTYYYYCPYLSMTYNFKGFNSRYVYKSKKEAISNFEKLLNITSSANKKNLVVLKTKITHEIIEQ